MPVPLIEFGGVTCAYGQHTVLQDVSFQLQKGQFIGVLGPSGAGKTTLLKAVLGIHRPVMGKVQINGKAHHANQRIPLRMGYVPQVETVDWDFPITVEQAVIMGRAMRSGWLPWASKSVRCEAHQLLERLEIAGLAKRHIRDLSGGQQQRVFLARALFSNPDLLILDEPTNGVDLRTQEEILHLLTDLNKQGVTILMTTHDLNAAASHLPWVICLNQRLIAQGSPDDVFIPEVLNETYQGDMIVIKQEGLIFVQERPHWHGYRDVVPAPMPMGD